jgi:hypothetical protein
MLKHISDHNPDFKLMCSSIGNQFGTNTVNVIVFPADVKSTHPVSVIM